MKRRGTPGGAGVEMQPAKLTASGFATPSVPESRVQEESSS